MEGSLALQTVSELIRELKLPGQAQTPIEAATRLQGELGIDSLHKLIISSSPSSTPGRAGSSSTPSAIWWICWWHTDSFRGGRVAGPQVNERRVSAMLCSSGR